MEDKTREHEYQWEEAGPAPSSARDPKPRCEICGQAAGDQRVTGRRIVGTIWPYSGYQEEIQATTYATCAPCRSVYEEHPGMAWVAALILSRVTISMVTNTAPDKKRRR